MAKLSPAERAEKWGRNLKRSGDDIRRGVERVTEAPGVKAAAKQDKMLSRLTAKVEDGTWAERVASVPVGEWREKMINKGIPRISAGVDGANGKVVEFHQQLEDHQERINTELERMPDVSLEDSISRMTHQVRRMSEFSFRRG